VDHDLSQLAKLKPLADDKGFRDAFRKAKHNAKLQFADWLNSDTGQTVEPDTISIARSNASRIQAATAQRLRVVVYYKPASEKPEARYPRCTFSLPVRLHRA